MGCRNFVAYSKPLSILPLLFAAVFFVPSAGLCGDYGDAYVTGSISDARTLLPILASDTASSGICSMLFNGLVKYDKDLNLVGDLAERWEIEEEGKVIVFYLRKNVFWHDGAPFTASDVEFTYRSLMDPQVKTPYAGDFERIESLKALDDHTVRVVYKEPFAPALSSWGMSIIPRHLLEGKDLNTVDFQRHPAGTGPFRFGKWVTQQKIELFYNPVYFEGRPFLDRYISRVIADTSTMFLELKVQGLDSAGLTPLQYKRQTDGAFFRKHYQKFRLPSFTYVYLAYNLKNPKFSDVRVRQALNLAVDKDELINIVLLGLGEPSCGPFVPQSWAYNPEVKPASFDPQQARELLAEAGWKDSDNDGWLDKEGAIFEFSIVTNQGNEERIRCAEIIQRRLKTLGIRVRIKVVEWSVFLSEFINGRNFETVLLGWSLPREPDNYDIWHSSKTKEGEFNFTGFANPEVDELLVKARRTFDENERTAYYHRINEIIYRQQPYMFLYVPDSLSALHKRFREVKPADAGLGYNFIEWWVPENEQRYKTRIEIEP